MGVYVLVLAFFVEIKEAEIRKEYFLYLYEKL
jgi:hypothetical protein